MDAATRQCPADSPVIPEDRAERRGCPMSRGACCGLPATDECRCHTGAADLASAVRSFVSARVRDRTDVDDVAQEALLRVYRNVHALRDVGALEGWAFQVARSAIADHYRRPGRRATPMDPAAVDDLVRGAEDRSAEDPTADLTAEVATCVASLLARLPERYRQALELTDLQGLTQGRAAAQVGLTTSGMKARVQRGRRRLREEVELCCHVAPDARGALADLAAHGCTGEPERETASGRAVSPGRGAARARSGPTPRRAPASPPGCDR